MIMSQLEVVLDEDSHNNNEDVINNEKEQVLSQIISVGLNSLSALTKSYSKDEAQRANELLRDFSIHHFDHFVKCYDLLKDEAVLLLFKPHKDQFLEFLSKKNR